MEEALSYVTDRIALIESGMSDYYRFSDELKREYKSLKTIRQALTSVNDTAGLMSVVQAVFDYTVSEGKQTMSLAAREDIAEIIAPVLKGDKL